VTERNRERNKEIRYKYADVYRCVFGREGCVYVHDGISGDSERERESARARERERQRARARARET